VKYGAIASISLIKQLKVELGTVTQVTEPSIMSLIQALLASLISTLVGPTEGSS